MEYQVITMKNVINADESLGGLCFAEAERDLPFPIRRVYCIFKVQAGMHRGYHAHTRNWQLLLCPYGSIDIIVDDGQRRETVRLDDPTRGLILHPGVWREMIWNQDDSVLCVAASEYYDANEYIRDYDAFLQYRSALGTDAEGKRS